MPDAARIAANKQSSEARKLLLSLQLRKMKRVDIAHLLHVEPSHLAAISKGDVKGDELIVPLRRILGDTPSPSPSPSATSGVDVAGEVASVAPDPIAIEAPIAIEDKQSVKDRLLAFALGKNEPQVPAPKKKTVETHEQLTTVAVLLVGLIVAVTVPEQWQPVAPTAPEATAILEVPMRWLCEELDVAGQLSERSMESLTILTAIAMYGQRAFSTYRDIKHAQSARQAQSSPELSPASDIRAHQPVTPYQNGSQPTVPSGASAVSGHAGTGAIANARIYDAFDTALAVNGLP